MAGKTKKSFWLKFLVVIILLGLVGNAFLLLYTTGRMNLPSSPVESTATVPVIDLSQISLTPFTVTPFQPLATETPTPTATLLPSPTPTLTQKPANTPFPSSTLPVINPALDGIPVSAQVNGMFGTNQSHSLSCESRSAVDLAGYFGVSIAEDTFQSQLPVSDDPDSGFVGSPDGVEGQLPPNSYGVHAGPVAVILKSYGLPAKAVHGYSFDELRKQIAVGHPVMVWVFGNVWSGGTPQSYTASNGHTTTVVAFEHTVIVTGYDSDYVMILDGGMVYPSTIEQFKNSWSTLGKMAVFIK